MITIDFETEAIVGNPLVNPPKPVGVAIWIEGREPFYLAWGHPEGNNTEWHLAADYLSRIVRAGEPLLFHNAGFDISVMEHWFPNAHLTWINEGWKRVHDTMYLLFLDDPYSSNLGLKPSADRYLGMEATEQGDLTDWIVRNIPEATRRNAGAYISKAPGDLVSAYAIGDVVRTRRLYDLLHPRIIERGMEPAYVREQKILPTLLEATRRGIRLDRDRLEWHEQVYTQCLEEAEQRLARALGCSIADLHGDDSFADALERSGAVQEWVVTKTGKRSLAKENLHILLPSVKELYEYRSSLSTCLSTFMRPWLEKSAADGRLHPNWNQVRQPRGDRNSKGTRTGRLSSDDPNFQNVPTEFVTSTGEPLPTPEGLHPLPVLRQYCLPEEGHVWLKRDFSSQEIRILAHFEDGTLCEAYRSDPNLDPHRMAQDLMYQLIKIMYDRKSTKITGFSLIYGTGVKGLSLQLGQSYADAAQIKDAYLTAFPGVKRLMQDVSRRGRSGDFIRTWGGRIYYAEMKDGKDFSYKLLNYLIQGSAADQTKDAIGDWEDHRHWDAVFLATVHDELNISAPAEAWEPHMETLKVCMERDRFDVPMLSEGFKGDNWHDLVSV